MDLGASAVTGMQVDTVYALRQALGLDMPGTPVKVVEPYQMLGEIGSDLREALGVDVVGSGKLANMFGFRNEGWKPWTTAEDATVAHVVSIREEVVAAPEAVEGAEAAAGTAAAPGEGAAPGEPEVAKKGKAEVEPAAGKKPEGGAKK